MPWIVFFGLIGFFSGILLYYFLLSLLWRKRPRKRSDSALITLLIGLLLWYSGNFVALLLRQMDVSRVGSVLAIIDAISFVGLSVLPALLFSTHWSYYRRKMGPNRWYRQGAQTILAVLALPLVGLPIALPRLFPATPTNPLERLGPYALPFLCMLAISYYGSAFLQWKLLRSSTNAVERALFRHLLPYFLLIPLFNFWVFQWGGSQLDGVGPLLVIAAFLSSLPPTLVVSYFIYYHRFLQVFVERRILFLLLILVSAAFYLIGIRQLASFLQEELAAPVLLVEGVSLAAILLLLPSLNQWLERHTGSLFRGELLRYRKLAETLSQRLPHAADSQVQRLLIEETIARELGTEPIRIHPPDGPLDQDQSNIFPLDAGGRRQGYLEIASAELAQSTPKRAAMHLLANEIAVALERSRLVETKLQLERELSHKSQMEELGRMAANVAHNVKNPLSSIKTLLQLFLEADNLTPDQKSEVTMMVGEVDRLSLTITSLLKFSRLEKTQWDAPTTDSVRLAAVFASLRTIFRGDLDRRGLQLVIEADPALPVLRTDSTAISDILNNLVTNAIEASPDSGRIQLRASLQDGMHLIEIEDDGPGIPSAIRKNLFEPFITTHARGTGLGLAIVKKQSERIGGTVTVESPLNGRGTRFTLSLSASTDRERTVESNGDPS